MSGTNWHDIRVVMLDWGGTLAHTAREPQRRFPCAAAAVEFLRARGAQLPDTATDALMETFDQALLRAATDLREINSAGLLRAWTARIGTALPSGQELQELIHALWQPWRGCLDLIDGTLDTLDRLRQAEKRLGLVSNVAVPPEICRLELERLQLLSRLDFMTFSSAVGWRKPHERIYDAAEDAANFGLSDFRPAQVAFVGDTPDADVDGPAQRGWQTVLVCTGNWSGDEETLLTRPDAIVESVTDLPKLLRRSPQ